MPFVEGVKGPLLHSQFSDLVLSAKVCDLQYTVRLELFKMDV